MSPLSWLAACTTVVYASRLSVAAVDQRGWRPATKETDLLSPLNFNPGVNAVMLGRQCVRTYGYRRPPAKLSRVPRTRDDLHLFYYYWR